MPTDSQTLDYGSGLNKDDSSQGNKHYQYINDPAQHPLRNKIRTKTPNIPRLPIDKISNTPTSLHNSQKQIINLKNIQKNKDGLTSGKALPKEQPQQFSPPDLQPPFVDPLLNPISHANDQEEEDSGIIDVNMFRQHSSPSPSQDDMEEEKGKE